MLATGALIFIIVRSRDSQMVEIPSGEFVAGMEELQVPDPIKDFSGLALLTQGGARWVATKSFKIDCYGATNAEYERFICETGWRTPEHWGGRVPPPVIARHPVVNVTWTDAPPMRAAPNKRLPTADEWEKAARETERLLYPCGRSTRAGATPRKRGSAGPRRSMPSRYEPPTASWIWVEASPSGRRSR